ncbi:hypothetical protein ACPC54_10645 [Kitasatospora sp. NPDC094028]
MKGQGRRRRECILLAESLVNTFAETAPDVPLDVYPTTTTIGVDRVVAR